MTYVPRFVDKFENSDGSLSFKFPLIDYEWETSQSLRTPFAEISGAHYGLDLRGDSLSLKSAASERIRFTLYEQCGPLELDTAVETMRSTLFKIGRGKLWTRDHNFVRRWSWARMVSMPDYTISFTSASAKLQPVTAEFRRQSDWRGESLVSSSAAATGTVTITNPGNARVFDAVLILSGTYTNPVITNTTNGYSFQSITDGSASTDWLKIDAGQHTVEFSENSGSSYTDDYLNYERPIAQVQLMVLEPGDNEFTFTGISSATLAWSFYGAWH